MKKSDWSKARKRAEQETPLQGHKKSISVNLQKGDIGGTLNAMRLAIDDDCAAAIKNVDASMLLERASKSGTVVEYCQVLAFVVDVDTVLPIETFASVLETFTHRWPPLSSSLLRLTLNLGIPKGGQVVPLFPDGAEDVEEGENKDQMFFETDDAIFLETGEEEGCEIVPKPLQLLGHVDCPDAATASYFGHFMALLHIEFLDELQQQHLRIERLRKTGTDGLSFMLDGLEAKRVNTDISQDFKIRSTTVEFSLSSRDTSKLRFRLGESVLLSRGNPLQHIAGRGVVRGMPMPSVVGNQLNGPDTIKVYIEGSLQDSDPKSGTWRLDVAANYTAYRRQFQALLRIGTSTRADRPPLWDILTMCSVVGTHIDPWVAQMTAKPGKQPQLAATESKCPEGLEELALLAKATPLLRRLDISGSHNLKILLQELENDSFEDCSDLNESQRRALAAALNQRLTLVQGPPGTGKTHVSVQLLRLWAQRLGLKPLLATSASNIAVDNIAECAIKCGLRVVRVGNPEKVSSCLEAITLKSLVPNGDDKDKLKVLQDADVICATNIGCDNANLKKLHFGAILIDEVAQATELSTIVPIVQLAADRLVLVGDQCQLPPTVRSLEAASRGLTVPLFSRLLEQGIRPQFLNTQFRMHPLIAEHSARTYYGGQLKNGICSEERPPPLGIPWPREDLGGMAFLHIDGTETREGTSWINLSEVESIAQVLTLVQAAGELCSSDVGIITPYSSQVRALRKRLRKVPALKSDNIARDRVEVASIDGFQGQEKELILFSAVRSNRRGSVGFLADWRRLNVMITRARRGLLIVGNMETLQQDPAWAQLIEWATGLGLVTHPT